MSTLIIRKRSLKTWVHTDSVLGDFIISKFYFNADNVSFQIVEQGQSRRVIYNITDITLYNTIDGGGAETFTSITQLSLRLEQLNYPAFQLDGQITSIANLLEGGDGVEITGDGTEASPYIINLTSGDALFLGSYNSLVDLQTAHPTALNGSYAFVSQTGADIVYFFSTEENNWWTVSSGVPTLNEVLTEDNETNGNDIAISNGDKILLDNGANLKKGTTDAGLGGSKGIALRCAVDYELKWEAGRLYVMGGDGFTIREVSHNFTTIPTENDDDTKGFVTGSRWILDNGDVYVCAENTESAAAWELYSVGATPTLQQVTDNGNNETTNDIKVKDSEKSFTLQTNGISFEDINNEGNTLLKFENTSLTDQEVLIRGLGGTMALLSDIDDLATPTLQEVTDQVDGNITTNAITLTSDTVPVNIGYNGYDVLTFTDNGVEASLGFYGLAFGDGTAASGLNPTSVEFNQNNKQTYYRAANILFRDSVTTKDLNINYPTSIVGTNKEQTFQDASGKIALTSDIPTLVAGSGIDIDDADPLNPIISATGGGSTPTLQEVTDEGADAYGNTINLKNSSNSDSTIQFNVDDFFEPFVKVENIGAGSNGYFTKLGSSTIEFDGGGDFKTTLNGAGGADNIVTLPSETGTLALTSDIPTKTSDLTNDGADGVNPFITAADVPSAVTSVGLTMPSAFSVANSPITSSGTLTVTGAGLVSQYVRGDGTLANFPNSTGGGSSLNYYLNGSVSQGTFGGDTFYEMSKTPILGAGTNFTRTNGAGNGYIASFITDAGDPSFLNIPAGNWNLEFYFQSSASGGSPQFYGEIYKVSATDVFTLVASGSANPEGITNGISVDQYFTSIPVPQTSLLITDRLAVRIYVITSGRTITLHTENGNLCEVLTTFTTGLTALNGLTQQVQYFDVGTGDTNFNISSSGDTHTFNLLFNIRRNANNSSNNNINYNGYAVTGSAESSAVWTITRLTISASGSITTATATNVAWTNRESATYI